MFRGDLLLSGLVLKVQVLKFSNSSEALQLLSLSRSGKCYKQVVLTPVLEKHSLVDSPTDLLPHTVTLVSMPSATNGKRGFSVSVTRDCTSATASVQVKE